MSLIAHPDGMPIQYLSRQVGQAAWTKYSVVRKEKRGLMEKVGVWQAMHSIVVIAITLAWSFTDFFLMETIIIIIHCTCRCVFFVVAFQT